MHIAASLLVVSASASTKMMMASMLATLSASLAAASHWSSHTHKGNCLRQNNTVWLLLTAIIVPPLLICNERQRSVRDLHVEIGRMDDNGV